MDRFAAYNEAIVKRGPHKVKRDSSGPEQWLDTNELHRCNPKAWPEGCDDTIEWHIGRQWDAPAGSAWRLDGECDGCGRVIYRWFMWDDGLISIRRP